VLHLTGVEFGTTLTLIEAQIDFIDGAVKHEKSLLPYFCSKSGVARSKSSLKSSMLLSTFLMVSFFRLIAYWQRDEFRE